MQPNKEGVAAADPAPIALFVYRRPRHTRHAVESLQKNELASQSPLYVFSDGPRDPSVADAVAEVRGYVHSLTGFQSVTVIEREKSWGLASSIIAGVTQLCNEYGRVVVLEDDLVVSPYFLDYMNAGLKRYESEERVMQISGHCFLTTSRSEGDAVFLPFTTSWGWATWQRAWKHLDTDMTGRRVLQESRALKKQFDLGGAYPYYKMLSKQIGGQLDTWDVVWYLSVFMRQGLALYPKQTLVHNTGYGEEATHTKSSVYQDTPLFEGRVERYPDRIETDAVAFNGVKKSLHAPRKFHRSVKRKVVRLWNRLWNRFAGKGARL